MTWAKAEIRSIRGRIRSDWKLEGDRLILRLEVPPNTTATVSLPTREGARITESGETVSPSQVWSFAMFPVDSGRYEFVSPMGP